MILTITPNPLLNYAIHASPEVTGETRCQRLLYTVGGKGINVSRMLKSFGKPALSLTFAGGGNGDKIISELQQQGIPARFVRTSAETRLGIDLFRSSGPGHDWWIEEGEDLSDSEVDEMLKLVQQQLPLTKIVAMSGTVPGKGHRDFYRRILEVSRDFTGEIYIDARGESLLQACQVGGFFLKHNREEAYATFNLDPFVAEHTNEYFSRLQAMKIWGSMITDGKNSILLWDGDKIFKLEPAPSREVSAVGCGDATLAGLVYGRSTGLSVLHSAVLGLAAGAADAECAGPCAATFEEVQKKLFLIKISSAESFRL